MTKITFFRTDNVFYGFKETGHTGFAESGDDVLCAALSAMTMLILNTVEVVFATNVEYTIDEKSTDITLRVPGILPEYPCEEQKRYAISGLFEGYYYQLNDMLEDYYEFLDVEVKDEFE